MLTAILAAVLSATVAERQTIVVAAPPAVVVGFLRAHPDELPGAACWTVLERSADTARLWRSTPRGPLDITIREQITTAPGWASYSAMLLRNNRGAGPQVVQQSTQATVVAAGTGARITLTVSADIAGLSQVAARAGLNQSLRGLERLLLSRFGRG